MLNALLLSWLSASIVFTVTETLLFKRLRETVKSRSLFFGKLISCSYCLSFWVAPCVLALYPIRIYVAPLEALNFPAIALIIAFLSAAQCALLALIMKAAGK